MPVPTRRPARARIEAAGADLGSMAALGRAEVPRPPSPDPPRRPDRGGPRPDPSLQDRADRLVVALAEAGVHPDADDQAAVQALAGLDPATLATVAEWIRGQGRGRP